MDKEIATDYRMDLDNAIYEASRYVKDLMDKDEKNSDIIRALRIVITEINRVKADCSRLEFENIVVEKRLKHLLESQTIRLYDEKVKGEYVKDIKELDNIYMQKAIPQYVINTDENTCLIFQYDNQITESVCKVLESVQNNIGCRCILLPQDLSIKNVIKKEDNICLANEDGKHCIS